MPPRKVAVVLVLAIAAITASCGRREAQPVVIGLNVELTGDIQGIGNSARNAAELFFARQNEAGGIELADGRRPVRLVTSDNGANATQAAAVAQRFISGDGVTAMIGPNSASCANAASDIAEALKCVMITPWSSDAVTTMDPVAGTPKRYVFRSGATDHVQGRAMAKFALGKLGARSAAIISDTGAAPSAQAAAFAETFSGGGEIAARETIDAEDADFATPVAAIAPLAPEVVFVAAPFERALPILEAAKAAGLNAAFLGTELWNSPQTIRMKLLGIDGLYFCRNFDRRDADPRTAEFVQAYTAKYNTPPDDVAALTYDACGLIAAALTKSGKDTREALRESLARLRDYDGVAGDYDFEPGSGDPLKSMPVLQIKNSGLEWVGNFGN